MTATAIVQLNDGDLAEVHAMPSGVPGLALTWVGPWDGSVTVTHENTGCCAPGGPMSLRNARLYAQALGKVGDWQKVLAMPLPDAWLAECSLACREAKERDAEELWGRDDFTYKMNAELDAEFAAASGGRP